MNSHGYLLPLLLLLFLSYSHAQSNIQGLNFVAPPKPFAGNPMLDVQGHGAEWIAVVPFAFTNKGSTAVNYNSTNFQWWGERLEGVETTIKMAKAAGLNVMLKPQVYVPGDWPGGIDFEEEAQWEIWEKNYTAYLSPLIELAEKYSVEIFCVGTEFKIAVQQRLPFWLDLIKNIRKEYNGQLTYAANWDEFFAIPPAFWQALDFAGVDAYYPLTASATPSVSELKGHWKPLIKKFHNWHRQHQRPIIFTEFGYLSVDGCAGKAWELEHVVRELPINQTAQANALEALFSSFWQQEWWAGGFIWKWFPEMQGHEGYPERDYTPQGKKGMEVLEHWYAR